MTPEPDQYLREGALQLGAAALVQSPALTQADLTLQKVALPSSSKLFPAEGFTKHTPFCPRARLSSAPSSLGPDRAPPPQEPAAASELPGAAPGPAAGGGLAPPGGAEGRAGPAGPCRGSSRSGCLSSGGSCRLRSLPSTEGEERRDPAHLRTPAAPPLECGSPAAPAVAQGGKGGCGGPLSTPSCLPAACCHSVTPASTPGIHVKVAGTAVLWSTAFFLEATSARCC